MIWAEKKGAFFCVLLAFFFERPRLNAGVPAFKRNACLAESDIKGEAKPLEAEQTRTDRVDTANDGLDMSLSGQIRIEDESEAGCRLRRKKLAFATG